MYLHIGDQVIINKKHIIGIFDIENTSTSKDTRQFLRPGGRYEIVNASFDMPKSFIVANDGEKTVLYITPISPATLRKRMFRSPY